MQQDSGDITKLKYKLIARKLFNERNYEEALKYYRLSIEYEESKRNEQIQYIWYISSQKVSKCLQRLGQFEELQKEYEQYYKSEKDQITLFNLVLLHSQLFQFEKAQEYLEMLTAEYESNLYRESKVVIYFYQRKYDEAIKESENLDEPDEFMRYIRGIFQIKLVQIQYITKRNPQIDKLADQQLHLILKAIIDQNDDSDQLISGQIKYDKIRQQFYQDIKEKQINSEYFQFKRYAYFEPFEQEFLLRQSEQWNSNIALYIKYFHQNWGYLTQIQLKIIQIYNTLKYQMYFEDFLIVFNQYSNISLQLKDFIKLNQLDKVQLEYVQAYFNKLDSQILSDDEIKNLFDGIEDQIEDRIDFIENYQKGQNQTSGTEDMSLCDTQADEPELGNIKEEQLRIRQGIIDSYFILFKRQKKEPEILTKEVVKDFIKFSLVKIIQEQK